jgi:hypothetical protein
MLNSKVQHLWLCHEIALNTPPRKKTKHHFKKIWYQLTF